MSTDKQDVFEGCDLASGSDRTVWFEFHPLYCPPREISREEFERQYLCQWEGGGEKFKALA